MRHQHLSRILSSIAVFLAVWLAGPRAQSKRPMTLVDLLNIPRVLDPQLSTDGQRILFTLLKSDWKAGRRIGEIWRIRSDGTGLVQMTNVESGAVNARWSPDGATFAFLARPTDADQSIYLLPRDGGDPRLLSQHATAVSDIAWAPDGAGIYFLASDPRTPQERERDRLRDDVFAFDENYKQQHLWKVSVKDGKEQKITDGDFSVRSFKISADGRQIVIHRAPTPLPGDDERSEVWVADATGANAVQLTHNNINETDGELSPDRSQVLFVAGGNERFESYYSGNVFVVPASGGPARLPLPDFPYEVLRASWSRDGRSIWMVVNMGIHSELFRLDLAAKSALQVTDGTHSIEQWSLVSGERHVFLFDEPARFGDVWTLGPAQNITPVRVTGIYDYLERDFLLPRQERVEWKGADGTKVEGLLYYPLDYKTGTRYPLCVQTHQGPAVSDRYSFGPFVWAGYQQVLSAKGYAVLRPNHRGSTGYGNAFLRDMVGAYFRNAHLDVLAGVDYLIKRGIADPTRLVTMGWSAGGHMTNKLITFTNRFKAASSGAGAANWISMYGQSDLRTDRSLWFGGSPWQKNAPIETYWEQSPLKYVSAAKTPTLFFVGQNDPRVPPQQSIEMYRALKDQGIPTHLYIAPREGHAWGELRHQLFKMNVELEWFEKYAAGRPYRWEQPPTEPATSTNGTQPQR